jgi:hypothetical protein
MRLPSKIKALLRRYEEVLFWDRTPARSEKLHGFYRLLKPTLGWLEDGLGALGLSALEVESEVYILCCDVYDGFDRRRSSIIPYLERFIPWYVRELFERVESARLREEPCGLSIGPWDTTVQESFHWQNIILNDSWGGKCFTRGQKYLIYVILTSDDKELSQRALARTLGQDVRRTRTMIEQLRNKLTMEEI